MRCPLCENHETSASICAQCVINLNEVGLPPPDLSKPLSSWEVRGLRNAYGEAAYRNRNKEEG